MRLVLGQSSEAFWAPEGSLFLAPRAPFLGTSLLAPCFRCLYPH